MICTFIGHKDAPQEIKESLREAVIDLIENKNVTMFYVGNHGHFDYMARDILRELKKFYPINYYIALAYMPKNDNYTDYSDTIYLDELNTMPYKCRIVERNKWMIKKSDFVVIYERYFGNTRNFKEFARKQNKIIINI